MSWPSGENTTALTGYKWPCNIRRSAPVAASHTRTVLSSEPDTISRPSGKRVIAITGPI